MKPTVPELRIRPLNSAPPQVEGRFVLYWMVANRRSTFNFSLQRAVEWAQKLQKPLLVFEALRNGYPWASDRIHHFVIQGMADNARALAETNAAYFPYLERDQNAGHGLLESVGGDAAVVVTDDFPCFFLPRMLSAVASRLKVRMEAVDSNGILPMRAVDKVFARAFDFRRFLQKNLRPHLAEFPLANPLRGIALPPMPELPAQITQRWPKADVQQRAENPSDLNEFPIDHDVGVVRDMPGGSRAATKRLKEFRTRKILEYGDSRNQPQQDVTSGLSPYLHFGHISAHEIFTELMTEEEWTPDELADSAKGSSSGWWGCSPNVESFLDELITWRELGYNMCWQRDDYDEYSSLPDWAQKTLKEHAADPRQFTYSLAEFEYAKTHDELWNAAQTQLQRDGRIHNYLRMLWGKKILEWSETPEFALETMIELNNKYALDGRNPNSYSGIFWVLGRYDRAWGPERPIFGKVRYMSSENTARKVRVKEYIQRYAS